MNINEPNQSNTPVCDLRYLTEMMGSKNHLIRGIMDAFLEQVPDELSRLNTAVIAINYPIIKNLAHTMKSSVSIMGITLLTPILKEMEELGTSANSIERINELNLQLNLICTQAINEIETKKNNYNEA